MAQSQYLYAPSRERLDRIIPSGPSASRTLRTLRSSFWRKSLDAHALAPRIEVTLILLESGNSAWDRIFSCGSARRRKRASNVLNGAATSNTGVSPSAPGACWRGCLLKKSLGQTRLNASPMRIAVQSLRQ